MALAQISETGPSGYVAFPQQIAFEDRTGSRYFGTEILALDGTVQLAVFKDVALYPERTDRLLYAIVCHPVASRLVTSSPTITGSSRLWLSPRVRWLADYDVVFEPEPRATRRFRSFEALEGSPFDGAVVPRGKAPLRLKAVASQPTTAEELRLVSGLTSAQLALMIGVSRTTYSNWVNGSPPRESHFKHLAEALAHVKDARRRLGEGGDVASWLRSPVSPGGKTPLQYLGERRFSTFRGLLLRGTSERRVFSTPVPTRFSDRPLSRAEFAERRERLSPSPRWDNDETLDEDEEPVR
jgi:transcriptional regulator with XRE-family HTH domain